MATLPFSASCIRDYHVTSIEMPPNAIRMMLQLAAGKLSRYDGQLDYIYTVGSVFPKADMDRFREVLPHTRLYFVYGAAETGTVNILEYSTDKKEAGYVGKPAVHSRLFIVDDDRKETRSTKDNPGLIAISGPLMSGYYNEPGLTKEVLVDGVLYANDLGYMGEDGYLYILGRRGDVINM